MISFFSQRLDRQNLFLIGIVPLSILGSLLLATSKNPKVQYSAMFLVTIGVYCSWPLCLAQVSANLVSDTAKAAAIGLAATFSNAGGLISTWTLRTEGISGLQLTRWLPFAACSTNLVTVIALHAWLNFCNQGRRRISVEQKLLALSHEEVQDLDWKHPGFHWKL